jgi:MATE family multidrug resistance protein
MGQPNPGGDAPAPGHDVLRFTIASSFASNSPLAERALAEDIAACSSDGDESSEPEHEHGTNAAGASAAPSTVDDSADADNEDHHPLYRRASGVAYGGTRPILNPQAPAEEIQALNPLERKQSRDAERDLLRDNHLWHTSSHPSSSQKRPSLVSRLYQRLFSTEPSSTPADLDHDQQVPSLQVPSETSPLLAGAPTGQDSDEDVEQQWEQALAAGQIRSSWQRESKTIAAYSGPLIVTFFLQYSVNVASIFAVGRIGTIELGAVSRKFETPRLPPRPVSV